MILQNYMWTAPNYFSAEEVASIHRQATMIPFDSARTGGRQPDPDAPVEETHGMRNHIRQGEVKWFTPEGGHRMSQDIVDKINLATQMAMEECGWYFKLEFSENYQYTIYNHNPDLPTGDFYTWHTDHGGEINPDGMHRKLSMTIQLADPDDYEGGHFQWLEPNKGFDKLKWGDNTLDMEDSIRTLPFSAKGIGSVCVFPSFLYHQVMPITRGTRISIVAWFNGYPWT